METELITTAQMYWLTRLTPIGNFLEGFACLSFVVAIILLAVGTFIYVEAEENLGKRVLKICPFVAVVGVALVIARCLLPTTREMAAIIVIPKVANNEKVKDVGNSIYDLAVAWMQELRPNKEEKGE